MIQIKELRKQNNITMKQLGEIIGVSESCISQYENGKRQPDYITLKKLAEYFSVSVDYLLDNSIEQEEIIHARNTANYLYREQDISIQIIEKELNTNYTTFRSWINGYGDYFNSASGLTKLADLFSVSVDYLLGRTDVSSQDENSLDTLSESDLTLLNKYKSLDEEGKTKVDEYLNILAELHQLKKHTIDGGYIIADPDADVTNEDIEEIKNKKMD